MSEVRDWIFTFGFDHEEGGQPLKDRYVCIRGTYDDARAAMVRGFGRKWAFQYGSEEEAGVERYGLTKLDATFIATPVARTGDDK